jgi:hypothetical protein
MILVGLVSACAWGANVTLPGGALTVLGTNSSGVSFVYSGTLTQNDTITLTVTGQPCLQTSGTQYCVNGAGVLRVPGSGFGQNIGTSSPFGGFGGTFTYGALMMTISGGPGSVQVFPTNPTNGSGSGSPPASLTINNATLSSLGFPAFSVPSPTITFTVGDTDWSDNGGQFNLTQTGSSPIGTPISNTTLIGTTVALALIGIYQLNSQVFAKR